ncbi:MAG TPA: hypothetical protein VFZ66_08740 [Herpetosiphonaceae bacterium]
MPELPALPLLVGEGESPIALAAEGFAGITINHADIRLDREQARAGLDKLYAAYLRGTTGAQALELAALPRMMHIEAALRRAQALFGLVHGPVSLAQIIVDDQAEPIINEAELLDGLAKHLFLRRLWLQSALERTDKAAIVWLYEPYLNVGESTFCAQPSDVLLEALDQALGYQMPRALWIGQAEATLLLPEHWQIDILGLPLPQPEQIETIGPCIAQLLAKKTALAWGIVPATAEGLRSATVGRLAARFEAWLRALQSVGVSTADVVGASVIMPEDTLAYLETADAERALALTAELSSLIRQSYGVD